MESSFTIQNELQSKFKEQWSVNFFSKNDCTGLVNDSKQAILMNFKGQNEPFTVKLTCAIREKSKTAKSDTSADKGQTMIDLTYLEYVSVKNSIVDNDLKVKKHQSENRVTLIVQQDAYEVFFKDDIEKAAEREKPFKPQKIGIDAGKNFLLVIDFKPNTDKV